MKHFTFAVVLLGFALPASCDVVSFDFDGAAVVQGSSLIANFTLGELESLDSASIDIEVGRTGHQGLNFDLVTPDGSRIILQTSTLDPQNEVLPAGVHEFNRTSPQGIWSDGPGAFASHDPLPDGPFAAGTWQLRVYEPFFLFNDDEQIGEVSLTFTPVVSIPEPSSVGIIALSTLAFLRRRRR